MFLNKSQPLIEHFYISYYNKKKVIREPTPSWHSWENKPSIRFYFFTVSSDILRIESISL
jgi:hypothetical protein